MLTKHRYLQISTVPSNPKPKPFSLVLPEESTLRDALTTHVALLRLRLGGCCRATVNSKI